MNFHQAIKKGVLGNETGLDRVVKTGGFQAEESSFTYWFTLTGQVYEQSVVEFSR